MPNIEKNGVFMVFYGIIKQIGSRDSIFLGTNYRKLTFKMRITGYPFLRDFRPFKPSSQMYDGTSGTKF